MRGSSHPHPKGVKCQGSTRLDRCDDGKESRMKIGRKKGGRRWLRWEGGCGEGNLNSFMRRESQDGGRPVRQGGDDTDLACASQPGAVLLPRAHLTMCEATFDDHNWEMILASSR